MTLAQGEVNEMPVVDDQEPREELIDLVLPADTVGMRLDQALAHVMTGFSRSRLQSWIKDGRISVDGQTLRPRDKVAGGERVEVLAVYEDQVACRPQPIPLDLVFADDEILVINKPAGLVVHPAPGNPDGTLQNGLLYLYPRLIEVPRAGIVHRLDKDTSGLLVVACTLTAHRSLVEQLQARSLKREYQAVATGVMTAGGHADAPIGRHPVQRTRMAVVRSGRRAVTHYRVLQRFRAHTHLRVRLETGRTHQIRVHLAHLNYPLVGDPVYGGRLRIPQGISPRLSGLLRGFKRQALHAAELGLIHPVSGEYLEWSKEVPADMAELLEALREDAENA